MGIKHHTQSSVPDEGVPAGAIKPSDWNMEHDIDGLLGALVAVGLQANVVPYLDADQAGATFSISDFVRATLMALADAPAFRAAIGAASSLSPALTGYPTAPTQPPGDNSTKIATTAYADAAIAALIASAPGALNTLNELATALGDDANFASTVTTALALKAPLNSPALTGTPTAPTRSASDNSTKIATTAYADAAVAVLSAAITTALGLKAPLSSPVLTGSPTGTTASPGDNSTRLATTAYADAAVAAAGIANASRLINGGFQQFQRGAGSYASGAYCFDAAYILTESGSVTVAQTTDPENGAMFGGRLTQPDATAKRIGLALPLESADCRDLRTLAATISARIKCSASQPIRFAILETTAAADAFTKAIVNNWASTSYTSGGFFTSAVNVIAVGSLTPSAATWASISATGSFGGSMNNAIMFVWTEGTLAQNGTLELNRCKFEAGGTATPFPFVDPQVTWAKCQRLYELIALAFSTVSSTAMTGRSYITAYNYRVTKRAVVTPVFSGVSTVRCASPVVINPNLSGFSVSTTNNNADGDDFSYSALAAADASIGV